MRLKNLLKQFNNRLELISFIEQLHKRGVEKIIEGKLDVRLDILKIKKVKPIIYKMTTQERS